MSQNKFLRAGTTILLAFSLLFMALQVQAQDRPGKRIALIIGNDAYQHVGKLEKAGNDATAMARELKAAGFEVLLHRDLNYRGMVNAVETLSSSIVGGDQVVVFFAGHGVQIKTGSYLLPVDIEARSESEVEKTAYSLNDLLEKLSDARASFTLVMVDACRDNPLKSSGRSVGSTRGLSAIEPPKGQMVVYSASKGQQALDSLNRADKNPNSVFTREFVARMKRPGVRIEDLVREVQDAVESLARQTSHEQRPAIYNEARGNFYFYGPTTLQVMPQATGVSAAGRARTAEEIEDGYWDSIKDSRDSAVFTEYFRNYPQGRYAVLARQRLQKLNDVPAAPATTFDGRWDVSLVCEDVVDKEKLVKGYKTAFVVDVKEGRLTGQYGRAGEPSYLNWVGVVAPDGTVEISADGITGRPEHLFGKGLTGRPYSYHLRGKLTGTNGKATRIELRPCEATFFKK